MAHKSTTIYPHGTFTAHRLGPRSNHYSLVRPRQNVECEFVFQLLSYLELTFFAAIVSFKVEISIMTNLFGHDIRDSL